VLSVGIFASEKLDNWGKIKGYRQRAEATGLRIIDGNKAISRRLRLPFARLMAGSSG
jgi:hypothetical protein